MKISCPKCNASGSIPEHEIPESGRFISCPRCNEGFTVTKPRSGNDVYLLDTCPSCGFSTFGDEPFSSCPKCGVVVKTFVERQREEQLVKRNQELLGKKLNNCETSPPQPEVAATTVADLIDTLHPVNIISYAVAAVAIAALGMGLWAIIGYDSSKTAALLVEEGNDQSSGLSVFLRYGLFHWAKLLYGVSALAISVLFMKRLKIGLQALRGLLWTTIALVPLMYTISFIYWIVAPIPHSIRGYLVNGMEIIFISTLVGVPLYLLERYLHERTITSVVKL